MKRYLLFIVFILFTLIATNAQWHYNSCGVEDINYASPEEFECLWKRANKEIGYGLIATSLGSIIAVAIMTNMPTDLSTDSMKMLGLGLAGILMSAIGFYFFIDGIYHKSQLRKTPLYELRKLGSLDLSPVIGSDQYDSKYYIGVSLSLNF